DPSLSIDQLSAEYSCDRSTISKILKEKDKWLAIQMTEPQEKKKTNQPAKFEELENAMNIWMRRVLSQNGILSDGILQVQAKKFAELLGIPEDNFKASHGWLDRFKKRYEVQKFKIQEESESAPVEDLPEHRRKLVELLLQYKPDDVYNTNKT
ncbi:5208_t:CDS:1, partial [Gigaspora rosea]